MGDAQPAEGARIAVAINLICMCMCVCVCVFVCWRGGEGGEDAVRVSMLISRAPQFILAFFQSSFLMNQ